MVLALAFVIYSHQRSAKKRSEAARKQPPPVVPITIETAAKGDIGIYVNALGLVTSLHTVNVRSRVDGELVKVRYREGDQVERGALLAQIDDGPFLAVLAQAEGQLGRDQAILENARRDVERYAEALSRKAIPSQQYDTQVALVRQYEDIVKTDRGQVESARLNVSYCQIRAPLTGRVGLRLVDPGNLVQASSTNSLVVITQIDPISVVFNVAQDYLGEIYAATKKRRLPVVALDRTQKQELSHGTLETIDNQIDTATGTVKLRAIFKNPDNTLFPNQFVNARLLVDTHRGVTLVKNPVVQRNAQGTFVYLVGAEHQVHLRPVTVVTTDGKLSEVKGIEPGAVVAADNFNRLMDGATIAIRPRDQGSKQQPR